MKYYLKHSLKNPQKKSSCYVSYIEKPLKIGLNEIKINKFFIVAQGIELLKKIVLFRHYLIQFSIQLYFVASIKKKCSILLIYYIERQKICFIKLIVAFSKRKPIRNLSKTIRSVLKQLKSKQLKYINQSLNKF